MVKNFVELFLSGRLFPPFFLLAGIAIVLLSRSKRYHKSVTDNNGEEHAKNTIRILKIGGPIMILCAVLLYFLT